MKCTILAIFKVYNSVAFSTLTVLCNYHRCLVLEHFHHPPTHEAVTPHPCLPGAPGNSLRIEGRLANKSGKITMTRGRAVATTVEVTLKVSVVEMLLGADVPGLQSQSPTLSPVLPPVNSHP